MKHFTSRILMISPNKFRNNELTLSDNSFQSKQVENISISGNAISEFEKLKEAILKKGISVHALSDDSEFDTPDAVFPNNWISFHNPNKAILYPMYALNRRFERKSSALKKLSDQGIEIKIIKDYSHFENDDKFLEGTGSIVLDRKNKIAYCSLSKRSNHDLLKIFCLEMNYKPVVFNSIYQSKPIYHTNVMMSICNNFSVICLESIKDEKQRKDVITNLKDSNLDIIDINTDQMCSFFGNCIQLIDSKSNPLLVMSSRAYNSINSSQLKIIEKYTDIIHSDIKTIEDNGGGSARCMIAEIF
ncbi:MAG: amidinotransferase [Cryomorphaceae bacterium]|nr:amidinotransferase [Cryomorphaceae bacterium]MBT7383881.1 amidinotransferase [Cryomorphaceae bacterium]MBT7546635.1 amidinotransferase [Cryomorphaceae bacterium]